MRRALFCGACGGWNRWSFWRWLCGDQRETNRCQCRVVWPPCELSPDDIQRIRAEWEAMHTGTKNAHRLPDCDPMYGTGTQTPRGLCGRVYYQWPGESLPILKKHLRWVEITHRDCQHFKESGVRSFVARDPWLDAPLPDYAGHPA